MEPLQDVPIDQVNEGMDSLITQVIKDFIDQLQPAYSGEGICCTRCASMLPCPQAVFPCTTGDIQAHLWVCDFLRDFMTEEPFHHTLEVYLEQPEEKARIDRLRKESMEIQEVLRSLPEIEDFLHRLRYLSGGNLKCEQPGCLKSEEFWPSYHGIVHHFRDFHCNNIEGAGMGGTPREILRRVDAQLQRPKTMLMIASVLDRNPCVQCALAKKISDFTCPGPKYDSEVENSNIAQMLEIQKPNWEQLRVLRTLRAKFILQHRRFLQQTAHSNSEGLQDLRKKCRRYADLLDTGLLTLKAVMNDKYPSSLKEVFAFTSLSYAMVETMQTRGKSVKFRLDKLELCLWAVNLPDLEDWFDYEKLISLLWPELELDDEVYSNLGHLFDHLDGVESISSVLPMRSTAERFLQVSSIDEDFCFSDWLDLSVIDSSVSQPEISYSAGSSHDSSWRRPLEIKLPLDSGTSYWNTRSSLEVQQTDWGEDKTKPVQLQSLTQTVLFMQAISFLICKQFRASYTLQLI